MTDPAVVNAYLGGARGARRKATAIRLPAPFPLPLDLASVGRFVGALALRAGAIRAAFVRALRQAAPLPSAFAGRYDPKQSRRPVGRTCANDHAACRVYRAANVAADGKRLANHAAELAKAATLRHARHIRSLRATRENPSAFVGLYDPATALIELDAFDPAGLARTAAGRMADHIRQRRLEAPVPSAFARSEGQRPAEQPIHHPALGHNSRGVDVDAEEEARRRRAVASISMRWCRAPQSIQSQHVASRRKRLTDDHAAAAGSAVRQRSPIPSNGVRDKIETRGR